MYYKIYNPEAGKWVSLKTNRGRAVLRNYINNLNGGASLETPLAEVDASGSLLGGGSRRTPMQEMTGGSTQQNPQQANDAPANAGPNVDAHAQQHDNDAPANAGPNVDAHTESLHAEELNKEEHKQVDETAQEQLKQLAEARDKLSKEEFDNEADRIAALAELAKDEIRLKEIQEKQTVLHNKKAAILESISKTEESIAHMLMELGFIDPVDATSKQPIPNVEYEEKDGVRTMKPLDLSSPNIKRTVVGTGQNSTTTVNLPEKPDMFQDGGRVNAELQGGRVNAELQGGQGGEFKPKQVGTSEFAATMEAVNEALAKLPEFEKQSNDIDSEIERSNKKGGDLQSKRHLNHYFTIQAQFKKNLQKEIRTHIQQVNGRVVKPIERVLGVFGDEGYKKALELADKAHKEDPTNLSRQQAVDKVPLTDLNVYRKLNRPMAPDSGIVEVAYDIFRLYGKSVDFKLIAGVPALNLGNILKEISNLGLLIQRVQMMGAGKGILTKKIDEAKEKFGKDLYDTIVARNQAGDYLTRSLFTPSIGSAAATGPANVSTGSINDYAKQFLRQDPIISAFYNGGSGTNDLDPVLAAKEMLSNDNKDISGPQDPFAAGTDEAGLQNMLRSELNRSVNNLYGKKGSSKHAMAPITDAIIQLDAELEKEVIARTKRSKVLHELPFWEEYNKAKRELTNNQAAIKFQQQKIEEHKKLLAVEKAKSAGLQAAVQGPSKAPGSKSWTKIIETVEGENPAKSNGDFIKMLKTKTSTIRDDLIKIIGEIQTLDEENRLEKSIIEGEKAITYEMLRKPAANTDEKQKAQTDTKDLFINRKTYNDLRIKLKENLQSIHDIFKNRGNGKLIEEGTIKFEPSYEDQKKDVQVKGSDILWDELEQATEKGEYDEQELKEILGEQLKYEVGANVDDIIAEVALKNLDIKEGSDDVDTIAQHLMKRYPNEWLQDVDSNGKEFYFNTTSNNSSYTKPVGVMPVSRTTWLQTIPAALQPSNDTSAEEASKHLEYAADALKDASDAEQSLHKKEKRALKEVKTHLTKAGINVNKQ